MRSWQQNRVLGQEELNGKVDKIKYAWTKGYLYVMFSADVSCDIAIVIYLID